MGMPGARSDARDGVLSLESPQVGEFRAFLATARGFETVGVRDGERFLEVRVRRICVTRIGHRPPTEPRRCSEA
jgi:hypothetical protein